jgi:hypothetical protein
MSFRHTVLLCAVALIPQFALAGNPPAAYGPALKSRPTTPQTPAAVVQEIGMVESVIHFCVKVDPADKAQFERKGKQMLPKMSEDGLEAARRRAEYHAAYDFIQNVLQGLSKADATRNCLAIG